LYNSNPELASRLAKLLSDVVTVKFIFQGYHWNVLGPDFGEYHDFFGLLYEDLENSIDPLGENILKLGFPAPYLLQDYAEMTEINEQRLDGTSPKFMLDSALRINEQLIDCYNGTFAEAESCREQGLMDFLAQRIDAHKKWSWQIRAYLGVR
jgi:starvation-inducible DNA-binding protein